MLTSGIVGATIRTLKRNPPCGECSKERIHWHDDFVLCQLHDDADDAHVQHVHALSWRKWSFPFRNCLRKTAKRQRKVNDLPLFFTARTAYTPRGLSVPKRSYYKISKENKTMKKHSIKLTALVLALVLTAALALTGCGSKSDDSDGATTIQIAVPNDTTTASSSSLTVPASPPPRTTLSRIRTTSRSSRPRLRRFPTSCRTLTTPSSTPTTPSTRA